MLKLIKLKLQLIIIIIIDMHRVSKIIRVFSSQHKPDNHFGFQDVPTENKQSLVNEVFHSVANKYDVMNDAMSMGVHRFWKDQFVKELGHLSPSNLYTHAKQAGPKQVLDVAGGTGDISFRILEHHGHRSIAPLSQISKRRCSTSTSRCWTREP